MYIIHFPYCVSLDMAKPIVRSISVDEAVHMATKRHLRKSACCRLGGKSESGDLPTMKAHSKVKRKISEKQRSLSTGDLQESTNFTLHKLLCFPEELLSDRGSSLYVSTQKSPQIKEISNVEILRQMDKKLGTLLDEVKKIRRTVEKQNPLSKTSRFSPRLGKKTRAWRGRKKRRQEQRKSPTEKYVDITQWNDETANLCLQLLLMLMNVKDKTLKDFTTKERTKLKSEVMSLAHVRKDSFSRETLERTHAKATMKDENCETLLDSFMYRDYHYGFPAATKTVELRPLIASSRNIDEYVSRELHSSLPALHSDGVSNSTSNDSRPSEGPHSMNLELIRLGTFKNFPASGAVSTIKLAKEGFYYSSHDDRVICFACGFEKSGWRMNDDPREIHRQGSPECSFINAQSVNVRVGESLNSPNGSQVHENSEEVSQQNAADLLSTENEAQSQGTEHVPSSENLSAPSSSERDHLALPCNRTVDTLTVQRNHGPEPQTTNSIPQERRNGEHSQAQSNTIHKRTRNTQEKINAFLRNLDPLGINFDRPKYPAYAVLATRVSSFQGWPASLTQQPRDLGTAGFFYVGYGDYTRCFFCGGGLRNWEPGDDPWTEHARWFPKCAFVRQNKGDEFVALVQIKHQELEELEAMGSTSTASATEQNTEVRNGEMPFDVSTLPSFQSVQEMGYSVESIKEAFRELKGTKNPEDITGMDIMDFILSKEDRNNGLDIPPQATDVRRQTSHHEMQSRNLNDSQNNSGTPNSNQAKVTGASSESLPSANDKEEEEKEQEKNESVAASKSEEKLDSLNNALTPMSLEDTRSLLEENRQLRELRMCKICMENEASIAMLPCGHLCCCTDCAPAMRKCPICRQFVKGTVRTWLA